MRFESKQSAIRFFESIPRSIHIAWHVLIFTLTHFESKQMPIRHYLSINVALIVRNHTFASSESKHALTQHSELRRMSIQLTLFVHTFTFISLRSESNWALIQHSELKRPSAQLEVAEPGHMPTRSADLWHRLPIQFWTSNISTFLCWRLSYRSLWSVVRRRWLSVRNWTDAADSLLDSPTRTVAPPLLLLSMLVEVAEIINASSFLVSPTKIVARPLGIASWTPYLWNEIVFL